VIHFEKSILKKIDSQIGGKVEIFGETKRFIKNGGNNVYFMPSLKSDKNNLKLVYLINFDCSFCIANLAGIYKFYKGLQNIQQIDFCLITEEKSDSYIKYWLDQVLKNYDLLVIRQQMSHGSSTLFLLDKTNKIIMAGDIIKYPFLKSFYIKRLREAKTQSNN